MRVAHAPGIPGTFSPPPPSKETTSKRFRHASRHLRYARAVMHVGIANRQVRVLGHQLSHYADYRVKHKCSKFLWLSMIWYRRCYLSYQQKSREMSRHSESSLDTTMKYVTACFHPVRDVTMPPISSVPLWEQPL